LGCVLESIVEVDSPTIAMLKIPMDLFTDVLQQNPNDIPQLNGFQTRAAVDGGGIVDVDLIPSEVHS